MTPEDAAAQRRSWLATAAAAGLAGALMIVLARGPVAPYLDTASALVLAAAVVVGVVGVRRRDRAVRPAMLVVSVLCVAAAVVVAAGLLVAR